jgi:hypothetical protein
MLLLYILLVSAACFNTSLRMVDLVLLLVMFTVPL